MSKHSVFGSVINVYFMHWTVANFRPQTWDLCVSIMEAYRRFDLKGMKNPLASKTKKRKASSSPASGPSKKAGKKATSNRQLEDEVQRGGGDGAGSSRGAGILVEEAQFLHNAKSMGMTFWINLSGLAGDAEFDKVDTYLRLIIDKEISLKDGGNMISQFKKERMVQKHLVSAAGLQTWDEFKTEFTPYWSSQEKIESLIGCLQRGGPGGRRAHTSSGRDDVPSLEDRQGQHGRFDEDIPRLPFTGAVIDCNYALDKETIPDAMTKEDVQTFLESFNAKTTAPAWTVAFFCGFVQQNDFLEVIDNYCSGRAERFFWHKQNVHMNPNNRASLLRGFPVVHQMYKRDGKVVNNHQKPLALLMELIQCHMLGDNPGKVDDDGHPLNWILDACCGVGSTSMAAIRCGLNAIGFDHDPYMVSSTQQRLTNFDAEPDQDAETKPKKKSDPTSKGKEAATVESSGDEAEVEETEENAE
ncbi:hypothetical protein CYMTET_12441 [Cymbomonas tetramitiformis]|uniref:DNA methylase N-4/N-6 domain-containing protein n=1 Tax=Cymbomonas tetramitiformis TaxID=36881 RepID=A0AAE0GK38_9CHLO|nr:hypothetical protein CYMTET_12441 [Cymbomonas tetramitiformis]